MARQLTPAARIRICEQYAVASILDILEDEENAEMVNDSVQDGFCMECGASHCTLEPDAEGVECSECGEPAVAALAMIILGDAGSI